MFSKHRWETKVSTSQDTYTVKTALKTRPPSQNSTSIITCLSFLQNNSTIICL